MLHRRSGRSTKSRPMWCWPWPRLRAARPGQWVQNTNGTHDVGPMQFNTSYLATLARYGITTGDVAASGCYPYQLAAWRLALHLQNDAGDVWQRAANYHSRTPQYNAIYRGKLLAAGARWGAWLDKNFKTVDVDGKPRAGQVVAQSRFPRWPGQPARSSSSAARPCASGAPGASRVCAAPGCRVGKVGVMPRLTLTNGGAEALKWLALLLMVGDHVNKYLFNGTLPVLFEAGRICAPLFALVFAWNLARPGVAARAHVVRAAPGRGRPGRVGALHRVGQADGRVVSAQHPLCTGLHRWPGRPGSPGRWVGPARPQKSP